MTTNVLRSHAAQKSRTNISEPVERWTVRVNGTYAYAAVISGDLVIVSVRGQDGAAEHLEAYRASDGTLAWTNRVGGAISRTDGNTIFVSSGKQIVAIASASGEEQWRFAPKSTGSFSAPAAVDGKVLYAADYCSLPDKQDAVGPSSFYCLDAQTGRQLWRVTIPTGVIAAPVSFDRENVYVVREYGLSCISKKTQSIVWSKDSHTMRASSIACDGVVVVPVHGLDCLSPSNGVARWSIKGGSNDYDLKADRGIIYTSLDSYFAAIRADTGAIVWKRPFSRPVRGGAALDGETVYLTCWDDSLYCLDTRDGRVLWRYPVALKEWAPTPLLAERSVLICLQDRILCIGQGEKAPNQVPEDTAHKFADPQH